MTDPPNFAAGQSWRYRHRRGEESSRLLVMCVEPGIVHIQINGIDLRFASGQWLGSFFMPISTDVLARCVTEVEADPDPSFSAALEAWLPENDTRGQGMFTVEIARFLDMLQEQFLGEKA